VRKIDFCKKKMLLHFGTFRFKPMTIFSSSIFAVLAAWHAFITISREPKNTKLTYTNSVVKFGLLFYVGIMRTFFSYVRREHSLRVLRNTLVHKRQEVTGDWRHFYNE
jgi:hypothetical protein